MISLIIAYKSDTVEREKNLEYCKRYYRQMIPNCEIIVQESSDETFNKCKLYNEGVGRATYDSLCFLDSDVFVSRESLCKSIEAIKDDITTVAIGYNGTALYLSYSAKASLRETFTYRDLNDIIPQGYKLQLLEKNDMFEVSNLRAVGGCLLMDKACFKDINGFNPNFTGWGYEDNEIILRSHKLGKKVVYINTNKPYLFHLPHMDKSSTSNQHEDRTHQKNENHNLIEFTKIQKMRSAELSNYIKSWQISSEKDSRVKIDIIDKNFVSYDRSCCRFQRPNNIEWDPTLTSDSKSIFLTDTSIPTIDNLNTDQQKVAWLLEPRAIIPHIYKYIENNYEKFDFILTYDEALINISSKFLFYPFGCCWVHPYITGAEVEKTKHMSIIASGKTQTIGHQLRHRVIRELNMVSDSTIDVLGNGYKPFKNKKDGLQKYRFSIVIENSIQDTYFTEKIIDCFATKTVPIYYGTSKITNFFDEAGIITFTTVDELKEIIDNLTDRDYSKMREGIENNFNKYKNFIVPENFIADTYSDLLL